MKRLLAILAAVSLLSGIPGAAAFAEEGIKEEKSVSILYGAGDFRITTTTVRTYNTYTGKMTAETTETEQYVNGTVSTGRTTIRNNDDGSRRSRTVEGLDGTQIYYNSADKVAATRDREGTWRDSAGKVIGRNTANADGTGESTQVFFKIRTGDVSGWRTEKATLKNGETTVVSAEYRDGKQTRSRTTATKEDGSRQETWNGVLRYAYDAATGEHRYYDLYGKMTSRYRETGNGTGTEWLYRSDGKAYERIEYGGASEIHYDGEDRLLWSVETAEEDGASCRIYRDRDGREFARTFEKSESKDEDGVNIKTGVRQEVYGGDGFTADYAAGSVTLEKRESTCTKTETEDGYTARETTEFTRWTVIDGQEKDPVTRTEESLYKTDSSGSERNDYANGTLTLRTVSASDENGGTAGTMVTAYDPYTGEQESRDKYFCPETEDDPISYEKHYDRYDNLQTYSKTDNTDEMHLKTTWYANGKLKQETWYDGLDGDSEYRGDYYLNGAFSYRYIRNGNFSQEIVFHRNGSLDYQAESADGVTNARLYDGHGRLTGYRKNEQFVYDDYDGGHSQVSHSYEWWDTKEKLVYSWREEETPEGRTETYTDPAGNRLVLQDGEWTLIPAAKRSDGWAYLFGEWFRIENGEPVQSAWRLIGNTWYYFNEQGMMCSGFVPSDTQDAYGAAAVYAVDKDGALASGGWVQLDAEGEQWAYTNAAGEVLTGWQRIGGKWYYFDEGWSYHKTAYKEDAHWTRSDDRGAMATGAVKIWNGDGTETHTYFFNEDGSWDNSPGWKIADCFDDIEYHYYDRNGNEATGWQQIGGRWYYFTEDGVMKNGWIQDGPNRYYLDPAKNGAMATGWVQDVYEERYYLNADGTMKTGWLKDWGSWYYLNTDGSLATDQWVADGGTWYYMGGDGVMATGWQLIDGAWYYFHQGGGMKTGWLNENGTWYYFGTDGVMVTGEAEIDGRVSLFGETGAWIAYK